MTAYDLLGILPELILVVAAFAILLTRRVEQELALFGLVLALASLTVIPQETFFFGTIAIDPFALAFMALFLGMAILVGLGSTERVHADRAKEYYALLLFATVGMLGVAGATDLITLFVSFELSSLSTYALVAYTKQREDSVEAATKFFVIGAFSSALALYGISLLYGVSGTTTISQLATGVEASGLASVFQIGVVLVLAGFGFKITVIPFHLWAPDTYEGAPTPITALLATGSKKMGFAVLLKIFFVGLIALKMQWAPIFGVLAVLTMTMGNLMALAQSSVKRMLAYSSIAQAGYILIAFPVATQYGLAGGLFHIVTHSVMTVGAFLVVAAVSGNERDDFPLFAGLSQRQPFLAVSMAVFMLSLAGIPPLVGFQSKFVLFSSAVQAGLDGPRWLIWLAIFGVLNSALSLGYYARVLKAMYFTEVSPQFASNPHPRPLMVPVPLLASVAVALAFVMGFGLFPAPILDALLSVAGTLL